MLELAIVAAAYYGNSILSNLAAYYSNSEQQVNLVKTYKCKLFKNLVGLFWRKTKENIWIYLLNEL